MSASAKLRALAAAIASLALLHAAPADAATIQIPFDSDYHLVLVSSPDGTAFAPIPGIPQPYSSPGFAPGQSSSLLIAGDSFDSQGKIYTIGLTRDSNGDINGFVNNAQSYSAAPGLPASGSGVGMAQAFGPNGVLFYGSVNDNGLSMVSFGGTAPDKQINLGALTPTAVSKPAALAFVPPGFPGRGRLKLAAFAGELYEPTLSADSSGTFDVSAMADIGTLSGDFSGNNGVTGLAYVRAGNPKFPTPSLLVAECDFNGGTNSNLVAYTLDSDGNPVIASARIVVAQLCVTGAAVDPATGDLLFTTFYGFPGLYVLTGFTVPPLPEGAVFASSAYSVPETASSAHIVVNRVGDTSQALTVQYATFPGSASAGVNYTAVSGGLHWNAGDASSKGILVPIKDDGQYNDHGLTVGLALTSATAAAPPPTLLTILNRDPKPTVSLSSSDRGISESAGTVQVTAALSGSSALPVTVPLLFSGSAAFGTDYTLDRDASNKPIRSIVITPGSTSGALNIHIVDDALNEATETLTLTMGAPAGALKGAVTSNTLTIQDNDAPPSVAFSASGGQVTEGSAGAGVTIQTAKVVLSARSARDVSVPVNLVSGALDSRITIVNPVVIPAGQTSAFAMTVADDAVHEVNKTITLSLGTPTNAVLGGVQTHKQTVKDDD